MTAKDCISVVIPAYREALGISSVVAAIEQRLLAEAVAYEIIVVDDGSPDETFLRVQEIAARNPRVRGIRLSRNFGKEAALLAGLRASVGDAVITIDADMQHPPAMIPSMIRAWRGNAMVVNAVKRSRGRESLLDRWRADLFNWLATKLGGIDLRSSSDYKLLDRQVVNILVDLLPEKKRFYRGLAQWIGFEQLNLPFDVESRRAGESSWSARSLIGLALTALLSFTSAPLRVVTLLGLLAMLVGVVIGGDAIWSWLHDRAVSGFATTIMTLLFLGSLIMISLGIIGEYIAKIYDEIKARPSYLVASTCGTADLRTAQARGTIAELRAAPPAEGPSLIKPRDLAAL
jgi:glycosyltransferase involved in cell wall biosynthesis